MALRLHFPKLKFFYSKVVLYKHQYTLKVGNFVTDQSCKTKQYSARRKSTHPCHSKI